ncbi:MAG: hypothetical protein AVDCRST_MAG64-4429, partial [uncultured Phycisphaerae bacterium]
EHRGRHPDLALGGRVAVGGARGVRRVLRADGPRRPPAGRRAALRAVRLHRGRPREHALPRVRLGLEPPPRRRRRRAATPPRARRGGAAAGAAGDRLGRARRGAGRPRGRLVPVPPDRVGHWRLPGRGPDGARQVVGRAPAPYARRRPVRHTALRA